VHDNLRNLQLDVLDVVNLRIMFSAHGPAEGSIAEPLSTLAELQQQGLVRHIGLSNVTATQVAEAQKMVPVVCVQNMYNIVNRGDDALVDSLAQQGIAYVPFFPLGGFTPLQSSGLQAVADSLGGDAGCAGMAAATFPNILLIPGTSSVAHLRQNLAAGELQLPPDALETLNTLVGRSLN
jgi:aryl-alcohol dehydrogenase-like predicted oxidoreductase